MFALTFCHRLADCRFEFNSIIIIVWEADVLKSKQCVTLNNLWMKIHTIYFYFIPVGEIKKSNWGKQNQIYDFFFLFIESSMNSLIQEGNRTFLRLLFTLEFFIKRICNASVRFSKSSTTPTWINLS